MGNDTKIVAHEDISSGTGIFYKRGYGEGHCSILPIGHLYCQHCLMMEHHMLFLAMLNFFFFAFERK